MLRCQKIVRWKEISVERPEGRQWHLAKDFKLRYRMRASEECSPKVGIVPCWGFLFSRVHVGVNFRNHQPFRLWPVESWQHLYNKHEAIALFGKDCACVGKMRKPALNSRNSGHQSRALQSLNDKPGSFCTDHLLRNVFPLQFYFRGPGWPWRWRHHVTIHRWLPNLSETTASLVLTQYPSH